MSEIHTFRAASYVHQAEHKDDVLAEAVSVITEHHPIIEARADRRKGGLTFVTVVFNAANWPESLRTTKAAASALQHRWPTDSVSLDGEPVFGPFKTTQEN